MKLKHLFYLITLFFLMDVTYAKKYYLDPINGSINNDGTSTKPWGSLYQVISSGKFKSVLHGDSLILRNGFHGTNIYLAGSFSSPLTITAESGHKPQLLKTIVQVTNLILDGITFSPEGTNEIGTPGTFDNGTLLYLTVYSQNVVVKNCEFYSKKDAANWGVSDWRKNVWSGVIDAGIYNKITNCHISNIAYAVQLLEGCNSTVVEKNSIENFSGDGIRIAGADNIILQNNVIKNSIELDANTIVGNHEDGIQGWGEIYNLIVRSNYVYNESRDRALAGFMQGIVIFDGTTTNALFENNVVVTEHWHGITLLGAYKCKIINNTVMPFPYPKPFILGPPWIQIGDKKDGTPSSGNLVRNNLAYSFLVNTNSSIVDHNVSDANAGDFVKDFSKLDFHPKPNFSKNGIAIIDAGFHEFAPKVDYDRITRPKGKGFDIGAFEYHDSTTVNVEDENVLPSEFLLYQNYPNPFNPTTTIEFSIDKTQEVKIDVYDILGREIFTLLNKEVEAGNHKIIFNINKYANELSSGIYFYSLKAKNFYSIKKMILVK